MSGRAQQAVPSSNPGGSCNTRRAYDAAVAYLATVINECGSTDVCVYGPMRAAPVTFSVSRLYRVVDRYYRFGARRGQSLIDFLAEHLRLSDEARYRIVRHRGWERALMYLDPTGNAAVRNVMKDNDD